MLQHHPVLLLFGRDPQRIKSRALIDGARDTMTDIIFDKHALLKQNLHNAMTALDFVAVYDSNQFQSALRRIRLAMGSNDPWEWSKLWAIRLRHKADNDDCWDLAEDRKVCLLLVFELFDKKLTGQITTTEVVDVFSTERVVNILQCCLPFDRAQSLFKMQPLSWKWGNIWQCTLTTEQSPTLYGLQYTNKRIQWSVVAHDSSLSIPVLREKDGCGCTLVQSTPARRLCIANVGDSRAFSIDSILLEAMRNQTLQEIHLVGVQFSWEVALASLIDNFTSISLIHAEDCFVDPVQIPVSFTKYLD